MSQWINEQMNQSIFTMEILIVGVIIVAIMAYASTKIKNAAKKAYEQEIIETEEFRIIKPEGFIIPLKESTEFEFEMQTKDFGEDEAENFYRCWVYVKVEEGIKNEAEIYEWEKTEDNTTIKMFDKTLHSRELDKTYLLEIAVLPEYHQEYVERIDLMLSSFSLK